MLPIEWEEYKPCPQLLITFDHTILKGKHETTMTLIQKFGIIKQKYKVRLDDETDILRIGVSYIAMKKLITVLEDKYGKPLEKINGDLYKRAIGKEYELTFYEPLYPESSVCVVFDDITYVIAPVIPGEYSRIVDAEPISEEEILARPIPDEKKEVKK